MGVKVVAQPAVASGHLPLPHAGLDRPGGDHGRIHSPLPGPLSSPDSVRESTSIQKVTIPLLTVTASGTSGRLEGQIRREVRAVATHLDATVGDRLRPGNPAGCQLQPGVRGHLDHVWWISPGVSRPGYALDRPVWWDAHLHRSAGGALREDGQQRPDRLSEHRPFGRTPLVERRQRGRNGSGLTVRRGHDGTIRPPGQTRDAGPGSRSCSRTRHSCRRRIRTVMIPGPAPRRSEGSQPGRRWTCQHTDVPGSSGPVWS